MSHRKERQEQAGHTMALRDIALIDGYANKPAVAQRLADCFHQGPLQWVPRRARRTYQETLRRELWKRQTIPRRE